MMGVLSGAGAATVGSVPEVTGIVSLHTMSSEVPCSLSVLDLLHVLNEKLGLGCTKIQESLTVAPAASLESEVSRS